MEMTTAARVVGGSDGFPGNTEESGYVSLSSNSIELEQTKQKRSSPCIRSGVLNKQQEGSGGFSIDDWRASKLTRTGCGFLNTSTATTATATATFLQNGSDSMKSGSATTTNLSAAYDAAVSSDPQLQQQQHQNMLCFSSGGSKSPEVTGGAGFAYYPPGVTVAAQPRNSGGGGGYHHQSAGITPLNTTAPSNNVYLLSGIRGPFTPSQWLELEQQALIYKYITSNEPIPRHLLIPIRIALEEAGMFAGLKPSLWGWGDMDPRYYSNRADPEPGRCRRTDGKKWRCSKDAMPDQKYCERHMNRGRHRSRKLVEAQANANNNNNHHSSSVLGVNKMDSPATTTMKLASSASFGNGDSSYNSSYDFSKNFQPAASNPMVNRMMLGSSKLIQGMQQQDTTAQLTFLPPSINLNSSTNSPHNSFSISNATQFPYSESTPNLFGVPSTGSLIGTTTTPSENKTTAAAPFYTNYSTYDLNHRVTDPETHLHNSFVDEWPNAQPDNRASTTTSFLWPGLHSKHNTQLSMSIPMGPVDFMSSTSSPTHDKSAAAAVSPLSLSGELLDQTQVYLGVGLGSNYHTQSQGNTNTNIPVSWEVSMGGPLGEVLQSSGSSCYGNSYAGECGKKTSTSSSPLNLLPSSSPTGVLQKSALISLSNSSAGSSPRADNTKAIESGGCGGQSLQ